MAQEQPFVLAILILVLRSVNFFFLVAAWPLHAFLAKIATPYITLGVASTFAAGAARAAAALCLLALTGAHAAAGPLLAPLLGFDGSLPATLAAAATIFAAAFGLTVNEKGTKFDRPWRLRVPTLLGVVEAAIDVAACAGIVLVVAGGIRVVGHVAVKLVQPARRFAKAQQPQQQPQQQPPPPQPQPLRRAQPAQSAHPQAAPRPPASWRRKVGHELLFTAVDWLCVPA